MARLGPWDGMLHGRSLRRWGRAARRARQAPLDELGRDRARARALRFHLDALLAVAEGRLAVPGDPARVPGPPGTDWAWRPRLWREALPGGGLVGPPSGTALGEEATLFHDCPRPEIALRQVAAREGSPAPFALCLDVFGFGGSYLGLALQLPPEASAGLRRRHLVRLDLHLELEAPARLFARLNVSHGPNVEALLRELPPPAGGAPGGPGPVAVEFDLAATGLNERRVDRTWLDLLVERPGMNRLALRDLTLLRLPRAEL